MIPCRFVDVSRLFEVGQRVLVIGDSIGRDVVGELVCMVNILVVSI